MKRPTSPPHGFTVTEMLVVIGVVILLLGLLFPVLAGFRKSAQMNKSMSNMRQIATWMGLYSADNRDHIVPSQFNYKFNSYKGKVRSHPFPPTSSGEYGDPTGAGCGQYCGTWSDILWAEYAGRAIPEAVGTLDYDYRFDSPDVVLHRLMGSDLEDTFRSAALNTHNTAINYAGGQSLDVNTGPRPWGDGAQEVGLPGYFAANNFFNADSASETFNGVGFYTMGQIRAPALSMYLVDSFAGEVIEATPEAYQVGELDCAGQTIEPTTDVDFRYADVCLMLFLDGHEEIVSAWEHIGELEGHAGRGIRIRELTSRKPAVCP